VSEKLDWKDAARLAAIPAIYLLIVILYLGYAQAAIMEPYMVKDINSGGNPWPVYMAELDGVFLARTIHSDTGSEPRRSDGTADGTWLVKDIFTGTSSPRVGPFTKLGDILLTLADDGVHGEELWRTNGTDGGTILVKDINLGPEGSEPLDPAVVNGFIYF
jgi:ELWxxDGT repeat protein